MKSVRFLEPPKCPQCKSELRAAVSPNADRAPAEGDATVCMVCGTICAFTDREGKVGLRMMYSWEIQRLPEEAQNSLQQMKMMVQNRNNPFELSTNWSKSPDAGLN